LNQKLLPRKKSDWTGCKGSLEGVLHKIKLFAMKSFMKSLLIFALLPLFLLNSCKDDDPLVQESEFDVLTEYMAQQQLDLSDVLSGWVVSGTGLNVDPTDYSIPDYYVIDIRKQEDFNAGHIKNAHNTNIANILDEAINAGSDPILVVCYTGQTAGRATTALRLMGYNAKSLKWGMSGWHSNLDGKWATNATDFDSPNWLRSGDPVPDGQFSAPNLLTNKTTGTEILEARVRAALNNSSWGISKTDVLANPSNYFLINKWPQDSWDTYGHINGSYRIDELLNLENLDKINPNQTAVLYCYTGQTSAATNMWLEVLGYDMKSILFGANGIVYSELVVGDVGSGKKKSWHGEGSGSQLNFGYYDTDGNLHNPIF
jgi:rhodanese-related sulfurtransferase